MEYTFQTAVPQKYTLTSNTTSKWVTIMLKKKVMGLQSKMNKEPGGGWAKPESRAWEYIHKTWETAFLKGKGK